MPARNSKVGSPSPPRRRSARETLRSMLLAPRPLDKGRVCEIAGLVIKQPRRLPALVECLFDSDPGMANRAADALERATACKPPRLDPQRHAPWKESLLGLLADAQPNKLRWNLALTLPRINLNVAEARRAATALRNYLDDSSSIVKTAAMQALPISSATTHCWFPRFSICFASSAAAEHPPCAPAAAFCSRNLKKSRMPRLPFERAVSRKMVRRDHPE